MGLDIYFRKITHPRKRRGDETLPEYLCDIRDKQEQEIANEAKQFLNDWLKKYKLIKGDHAKFEIANLYHQLHKYSTMSMRLMTSRMLKLSKMYRNSVMNIIGNTIVCPLTDIFERSTASMLTSQIALMMKSALSQRMISKT